MTLWLRRVTLPRSSRASRQLTGGDESETWGRGQGEQVRAADSRPASVGGVPNDCWASERFSRHRRATEGHDTRAIRRRDTEPVAVVVGGQRSLHSEGDTLQLMLRSARQEEVLLLSHGHSSSCPVTSQEPRPPPPLSNSHRPSARPVIRLLSWVQPGLHTSTHSPPPTRQSTPCNSPLLLCSVCPTFPPSLYFPPLPSPSPLSSCGNADATQPAAANVAPQPDAASVASAASSTGTGTVVNVAPAPAVKATEDGATPAGLTASSASATVTTEGVTISQPVTAAVVTATTTTATADAAATAVSATPSGISGARPKIAVIYYSTWGHMRTMAEAVVKGAQSAGADVSLYQIAETLPEEVLAKMHAPPKPADIPTITVDLLPTFDGLLFGAPTRYGQPSAQFKALWDATGQLWATGALSGKLAGVFFGTATMGGGQETTAWANMGHFVHHGMLFVPMGYGDPAKTLFDLDVVHGGSPWGAGYLAGGDGSRAVSEQELGMGTYQGKRFAEFASQMVRGRQQ